MFRRSLTGRLALPALALTASISWMTTVAASPEWDDTLAAAKPDTSPDKPDKDKASKKPRFPKFDKVTEGMKSRKGLFTLWFHPKSAKDKNPETLLCQIPSKMLGEQFMLSTSFSGGGFFTGFPLGERVVKWEIVDKQLVLVEPKTGFVFDKKQTVSDVVRRTYPERIRVAVPIVTKTSSGDPVIDLGKMLKSNFADIAWMSRGGGGVNAALSKWTKRKAFKLNVEIGVELAIRRKSPPGSYDKKMVHFSFWKLPKSDYKPRIADDRVGYFLTANRDWGKPTGARDLFNRYIDRWHLVKRDSSLDMCEPKQPIIFYIEKTVPVKFRRAVRDGILEWNKAFEKIGFIGAVVVRQQTDDNEWKDLDPEDMRYSFFRWIVTGAGFAMGPHRSNPFTGQIYDADIIFDDSMVRFYEQSAKMRLPLSALADKRKDPALRAFFESHPQFDRLEPDWEGFLVGEEDNAGLRDAMAQRLRERGDVGCDYHEGMRHQVTLGYAMLAGEPAETIDRLLYDVIKEVVTHEVGHTLGLRHNFKASTIYSLEEIKRRRATDEPTSGSVMDYNPLLFVGDKSLEGRFVTPVLGPYDYWAIEYGYRPADGSYKPAKKTEDEEGESDEDSGENDEVASTNSGDGGSDEISKELFEKLPPSIQKLIESSAGKSDEPESKAEAKTKKKSSAPAFKGPNAAERKMLHAIASRASEPELIYATDEDTTFVGPDPRSNRFDMSSDPIEWARERMTMIDGRLETILDWAVKERESWYHLRRAFVSLISEKSRVLGFVGRYVGGQYNNRGHRGDTTSAPFEMIDAKKQRDALAFIEDHLYTDEFFEFSPELLNHLTVPRWYHTGARVSYTVDFPIHRMIASMQWSNLFTRLFPNTLRRIHDAEMKTAATDRFTVAEHIQRIQQACWSGTLEKGRAGKRTWTDAAPFISSTRRSLQREYLTVMEPLVRSRPGTVLSPDLHAMIQFALRKLKGEIDRVAGNGKLDFSSAAHLTSCQSRIERMLAPELREY